MSDAEYTKRELDYRFDEIHEKLDAILAQTKDTHTNLSERVTSLEGWRQWSLGATAILWLVVVPLIVWIANKELTKVEGQYNTILEAVEQ